MRKRGIRRNKDEKEKVKDGSQSVIVGLRETVTTATPILAPEAAPRSTAGNKLSIDEAALTAKNYRLAKELVRYIICCYQI
jgi:hypothetical protein